MKVTNKVKIEKVYLFNENKPEPVNTANSKNDDKTIPSKMPMSAELLRGSLVQFFGVISIILFFFYIANFFISFAEKYSTLNRALMCLASATLIFPYFIFLSSQTFLRKRNLTNAINKSMGISMIIVAIIAFIAFKFSNAMGLQILFQLLFIFASMFFFAISRELEQEENRDYILNYFSALTAFVALIVSFVALFK